MRHDACCGGPAPRPMRLRTTWWFRGDRYNYRRTSDERNRVDISMSYDKINDQRTGPSAYPYGQPGGPPPPTSYQVSGQAPSGPSANFQNYNSPYGPPPGLEQEDEVGEGGPISTVSVTHLNVSGISCTVTLYM